MLLQIEELTKVYRTSSRAREAGTRANDGISLAIGEGEVFGLLGHNGAGKTTLVNQVVGLLRPTSGTIRIDGRDMVADPGLARRLCSSQAQAQVPIDGLTPRQAIDLLGQLRGASKAAPNAVASALSRPSISVSGSTLTPLGFPVGSSGSLPLRWPRWHPAALSCSTSQPMTLTRFGAACYGDRSEHWPTTAQRFCS